MVLAVSSASGALFVGNPDNILGPGATTASDATLPGADSSKAVDNLAVEQGVGDNGLIFASPSAQRLTVSGYDATVDMMRLYFAAEPADRLPTDVVILSSESTQLSLDAGDFEDNFGSFPLSDFQPTVDGSDLKGYVDITLPVTASKSMLLTFSGNTGSGARVSEVQLFAVPEPTTAILGVLGVSFACFVRRRNR